MRKVSSVYNEIKITRDSEAWIWLASSAHRW